MTLTSGSVRGTIYRFSLPLILTFLISQAYSIADTVIVSNLCDSNDLACISAASTVLNVSSNLLSGMVVGFGILTAKALGGGDEAAVRCRVRTTLFFFALVSAGIGGFLVAFARPLLVATQVPAEILDLSATVLRIYGLGAILYGMIAAVTQLLENLGLSKPPLYCSIACGALNVGLDLAAVLPLRLGMLGTVWASVICQTLQLLMLCCLLARACRPLGRHGRLELPLIREAFRYSGPTTAQYALNALSLVVVQTIVNSQGTDYINGFSGGILTYSVLNNAINGYGRGYQVFLSQNYGARRLDRIRQAVAGAPWDVLIIGGAVSALLLALSGPIIGFLIGTKGEVAIAFATWFALLLIPNYFLGLANQLLSALLRVLNHNQVLLGSILVYNLVYVLAALGIAQVNVMGISLSMSLAAAAQLALLETYKRRHEVMDSLA